MLTEFYQGTGPMPLFFADGEGAKRQKKKENK